MIPGIVAGQMRLAAAATDPLWASVMGLWHFDGVAGGTTFIDSKNGQVAERVGACVLDDTVKVFGPTALRHPTGAYLRFPKSPNTDGFGYSDAWTVEGLVYIDVEAAVDANAGIFEIATSTTAYPAGLYFQRYLGNWYLYCYAQGSPIAYVSGIIPIVHREFFSFRLVSTGSSFAIFINGELIPLTSFSFNSRTSSAYGLLIGTGRASLGSDGSLAVNGVIDELRITKASRGTSAYTPDAVPFPNG